MGNDCCKKDKSSESNAEKEKLGSNGDESKFPAAAAKESKNGGKRILMSLSGGQKTVGEKFVEEENVQGYIFDLDGTLIDTMPLFYPSWVVAGEKYGLPMTENEFYGFAGVPLPDIVRRLHAAKKGTDDCTEEFVTEFLAFKSAAHAEIEKERGSPPAIPCVVKIAREAVARGIPVAVATSGTADHVIPHIAHAGIADLFSREKGNLVCAAEVKNGKPAPDIFLEAARRVGVDPKFCRAYEDGESGLMSAHAAGMHVIDVTYMDEYPMVEGLRVAKADTAAGKRAWLKTK